MAWLASWLSLWRGGSGRISENFKKRLKGADPMSDIADAKEKLAASAKETPAAATVEDKAADGAKGRRPPFTLIVTGIALFIVIALGLGLGLGLGLKRHHGSSPHDATAQPILLPDVNNGSTLEMWRLNTATEYLLDENWDLYAAPTTRIYNFTISESVGWPDGE